MEWQTAYHFNFNQAASSGMAGINIMDQYHQNEKADAIRCYNNIKILKKERT